LNLDFFLDFEEFRVEDILAGFAGLAGTRAVTAEALVYDAEEALCARKPSPATAAER